MMNQLMLECLVEIRRYAFLTHMGIFWWLQRMAVKYYEKLMKGKGDMSSGRQRDEHNDNRILRGT